MSAETLRRAAAKMRERAEAATPGPWSIVPGASNVWRFPDEGTPTLVVNGVGGNVPARSRREARMTDAEHIASWHPAVALAVADWLDSHAEIHALRTCDERLFAPRRRDLLPCPALALARAYLGSDQ